MGRYLILAGLIFFFSSCVTTQSAFVKDKGEVTVLFTKTPKQHYEEIVYLQADGAIFHNPKRLLKKLKQAGAEHDVDAIINVEYGYQFWWPYVSGVGVRYK